jgi:hypothetical protein
MVDLCGAWSDFCLCEVAHGVAQGIDIFTELEIQAW